jgi:hypothetical protein
LAVSAEYFVFGKLIQFKDGPVLQGAGHQGTSHSCGFPEELIAPCMPQNWMPHLHHSGLGLGAASRARGCLLHRAFQGRSGVWLLYARLRERPESGEGGPGRAYVHGVSLAIPLASWRWSLTLDVLEATRRPPDVHGEEIDGRAVEIPIHAKARELEAALRARLEGTAPRPAPSLSGDPSRPEVIVERGLTLAARALQLHEGRASIACIAAAESLSLPVIQAFAVAQAVLPFPLPYALGVSVDATLVRDNPLYALAKVDTPASSDEGQTAWDALFADEYEKQDAMRRLSRAAAEVMTGAPVLAAAKFKPTCELDVLETLSRSSSWLSSRGADACAREAELDDGAALRLGSTLEMLPDPTMRAHVVGTLCSRVHALATGARIKAPAEESVDAISRLLAALDTVSSIEGLWSDVERADQSASLVRSLLGRRPEGGLRPVALSDVDFYLTLPPAALERYARMRGDKSAAAWAEARFPFLTEAHLEALVLDASTLEDRLETILEWMRARTPHPIGDRLHAALRLESEAAPKGLLNTVASLLLARARREAGTLLPAITFEEAWKIAQHLSAVGAQGAAAEVVSAAIGRLEEGAAPWRVFTYAREAYEPLNAWSALQEPLSMLAVRLLVRGVLALDDPRSSIPDEGLEEIRAWLGEPHNEAFVIKAMARLFEGEPTRRPNELARLSFSNAANVLQLRKLLDKTRWEGVSWLLGARVPASGGSPMDKARRLHTRLVPACAALGIRTHAPFDHAGQARFVASVEPCLQAYMARNLYHIVHNHPLLLKDASVRQLFYTFILRTHDTILDIQQKGMSWQDHLFPAESYDQLDPGPTFLDRGIEVLLPSMAAHTKKRERDVDSRFFHVVVLERPPNGDSSDPIWRALIEESSRTPQ